MTFTRFQQIISAATLAGLIAATTPVPVSAQLGNLTEPPDTVETVRDPGAWDVAGTFNLTHTQSAYSDNWAGDEQGQLAWTSTFNFVGEKKVSELLNWRSTLDMQYGQTQTQDPETELYSRPAKNNDRIQLESVMRFTLQAYFDPFLAGRVETQFTDQRTGDLDWLNPVTYTESAGIARTFWEDNAQDAVWLGRLGAAFQQRRDMNFPVNPELGLFEDRTTYAAGAEFVSELITPVLTPTIRLDSKLIVFQALYNSMAEELKGTPGEDYWRSPDVDLEAVFTANLTRLLMVNLYTRLLYDREIATGGRFKETLGLGLTYILF